MDRIDDAQKLTPARTGERTAQAAREIDALRRRTQVVVAELDRRVRPSVRRARRLVAGAAAIHDSLARAPARVASASAIASMIGLAIGVMPPRYRTLAGFTALAAVAVVAVAWVESEA